MKCWQKTEQWTVSSQTLNCRGTDEESEGNLTPCNVLGIRKQSSLPSKQPNGYGVSMLMGSKSFALSQAVQFENCLPS